MVIGALIVGSLLWLPALFFASISSTRPWFTGTEVVGGIALILAFAVSGVVRNARGGSAAILTWTIALAPLLLIIGSLIPLISFVIAVPIGIFLCRPLVSGGTSSGRPFGIYFHNRLLSPSEADAAIQQFDEQACGRLLRAFGHPSKFPTETLDELRMRCQEALRSHGDNAA